MPDPRDVEILARAQQVAKDIIDAIPSALGVTPDPWPNDGPAYDGEPHRTVEKLIVAALTERQQAVKLDCVEEAASEAVAEVRRAMTLFGPFKNGHEGWAIIREEVDELWDEVKHNKATDHVARQRKEAIQIATMALRFVVELGRLESTR